MLQLVIFRYLHLIMNYYDMFCVHGQFGRLRLDLAVVYTCDHFFSNTTCTISP